VLAVAFGIVVFGHTVTTGVIECFVCRWLNR
jgi:hypothetical protein